MEGFEAEELDDAGLDPEALLDPLGRSEPLGEEVVGPTLVVDELALLEVAEAEPGELLIMDDAQVMLGLEDGPEEELPVALELEVAFADTLEEVEVDADPELLDEVALIELEILLLAALLLLEIPELEVVAAEVLFVDATDPVDVLDVPEMDELGTL